MSASVPSLPLDSNSRMLVAGNPFFLSRHRPLIAALAEHWPATREFEIVDREPLAKAVFGARAALTGGLWPPKRSTLAALRNRFEKEAASFRRLSAQAQRGIEALEPPPDFVFQFFAMSSPVASGAPFRYAHYTDMTMAFVHRLWPAWAPYASEAAYQAWIAVEGRSYREADRVFTFSEATRRSVIDDYGALPERVVAVGAAGHYREASTTPRTYGSRSIVFNGSDFERKGGDLVLGAFRLVRAAVPDATLAIVGTSMALDEPGVSVLGNVSREELFSRLDRTDALLAPARLDVLPGFTLESMSRGVVPIVSDCPSMGEMLVDGAEGYVVSPTTVEALAARAVSVLQDPESARALGSAARTRVERDWNWAAVAARIAASLGA